jgi:asparagine synthetase B (glutamine-hydrolysing)
VLVDLLRSAVSDRLDGEVGIVLSGGLDSSTVAALAPPLPTFTGWYDGIGFDERFYARLVGAGTHHEVQITPRDFVEHFDGMAAALTGVAREQGPGAFGQYMVARFASNYVSVLLSGEGSDELFGGYARTLLAAGEPMPTGYEGYRPPEGYPAGNLAAALQYDLDRLPDLLAVDDQMCGAWGIEGRAPFTDPRIVEYALALPVTERVGKRHLRRAVRGIVPDPIIDRQSKMGFPIPWVGWAQREPVRTFVGDRLGYLPDPAKPWSRSPWRDLLAAVAVR